MIHHFHISRVAQEIGLNPPTIRYYEQIGLLPPPTRSENGYRLYSPDDLARLRFVKRARLLDLPLEEIGDIMAYALDGHCGPLQAQLVSLLETKMAEVNNKIRELNHLKADLKILHQALTDQTPTSTDVSPSPDPGFCACLDKPKR